MSTVIEKTSTQKSERITKAIAYLMVSSRKKQALIQEVKAKRSAELSKQAKKTKTDAVQ